MSETNYSIAEYVDLPSGGKIYDKPVEAEIKLRAMTGRDELKRAGGKNSFKVLYEFWFSVVTSFIIFVIYDAYISLSKSVLIL